jgi:putative hydrolase of the HAD superfamily
VAAEDPIEKSVDVVLFDLGGVLIQAGGVGPMRELCGIESEQDLWARWLGCRWVQLLEAGRCSDEEFAAGVVADWELPVSPDDFLAAFASWEGVPYAGSSELVAETANAVRVGCLSNTNALQWSAHYERLAIAGSFEFRFLSFELGLVKPDRAIFDAVASRLPVSPDRVLFLDDNVVNVDGAADFGFRSRQVRGVDEARRALLDAGVLAG